MKMRRLGWHFANVTYFARGGDVAISSCGESGVVVKMGGDWRSGWPIEEISMCPVRSTVRGVATGELATWP